MALVRRFGPLAARTRARAQLRVELLEDRSVPSIGPIDVLGHLPAAEYNQFIPNAINFQGNGNFKDWGNEPSIAVNPLHPDLIVVSTFAYGGFIVSGPGSTNASIWYSTDGGADWTIRFPIPISPAPGEGVPNDQTFAYDSKGVLRAAMLTFGLTSSNPGLNIFQGTTTDPNADGVNGRPATVWQWDPSRVNLYNNSINNADQPWLALSNGQAFVGYGAYLNNGKGGNGNVEMRVSASADNGATFTTDQNLNSTNDNGSLPLTANPGIRLATDKNGDVYSIYGWGQPPSVKSGETTLVHYRLNMSADGGKTWQFTSLGGQAGGLVIDDGQSLQLGSSFGGVNRLTGNITAIAADPSGAHVYAVYGKEDATGTDRLFLAEFHPDGSGGLVERANPLPFSIAGQRSALPSIAVTDNGTIAVQYDTFTEADGRFHVHLATSTDQGQTFTDQDLYDFTTTGIPYPFTGGNRLLGDYQGLIALGNKVYGTFAGRGDVTDTVTGIDTTDKIVPFFYSVALPGGRLGFLVPSLGGSTTGSAGSAENIISATGSAGVIGAALPGDRGLGFATQFGGPATALSNSLLSAIPIALNTGAPDWFGSGNVLMNHPDTSSIAEKNVQVLVLQRDVTGLEVRWAVNGWQGEDRRLNAFGATDQPQGWTDGWVTEGLPAGSGSPDSKYAG
jgi:hypothetical protein